MKETAIFLFITTMLVTIIILSWFSEGKIIANGSEENLNIFHSQQMAEKSSSFWQWGGTGYKTGFGIQGYPTFAFLGFLERQNVPASMRQAVLLETLIIAGILFMYTLLRHGLKLNYVMSFVGSFFYFLNIYSMTQVWKRFLYNGMFAWTYLPLFIFLWIKWLEKRNVIWLLIFSLSSFFFSATFAPPTFLFTIWSPAIIFSVVNIWQSRKEKKRLITILFATIAGFAAWIIINIWWLYPSLVLSQRYASESTGGINIDFDSLRAVSQYFPVWEVVLLRQSWYLGPEGDWNNFYHNPIVIIINTGVFLIMVYGILRSKEQKYRSALLTLGFVGIFVSKGTNFPLGHTFFYSLFSLFPFTTMLRNSYEKFGLVWLLPYTIFFAIGFYKLITHFKSGTRYVYSFILLILFCGILVYPIWTGDIFPSKHRVNIPNDYIEANAYLKNQFTSDTPSRVFHIPYFLQLDRLKYSWGFVGIDPSDNLFEFESATIPKIPFYLKFYEKLPNYWETAQFPRILGFFGIEHIIVHKDSFHPNIDIGKQEQAISLWDGVQAKKEFGLLTVYSLDKQLVRPRIYTTVSLVDITDSDKELQFILSKSFNLKEKDIFLDANLVSFDLSTSNFENPEINFKKISNDHYSVKVTRAVGPYVLVLNNTFDNSWQLKINNQIINKHLLVNGFANGWLIEKKGDYYIDIKLKVWPWD